jgi:predicted dehydrogenase
MAAERVPVGVFGTGYLGRVHARVVTEIPEIEAVGFYEPSDDAAAELHKTLPQLKRFESFDELAGLVRAAVVASTTTTHFEVASRLLDRGVDLMIEKPVTATLDDGRELLRMARERERIIQVGHVERYNPAITAIAGSIGAPRYVEAERLGVFVGRSLDVDVLLDLMIHDLNLVLSFVGKKIVKIDAVGVPVLTDKVDLANVRLETDTGAVAVLTASRVSADRVRKFRFFGDDVYFSVNTKDQEAKGFRLERHGGTKTLVPMDITVEKKEPLRAQLEAFIDCVKTRQRPLVSGEDGLEALELAYRVGEAIEESMRRVRR